MTLPQCEIKHQDGGCDGSGKEALALPATGVPTAYAPTGGTHMAKKPSALERVPSAPPPSARTAAEGLEIARNEMRRYLPDFARLLVSISLAPESSAALHTRYLAAKDAIALAGAFPTPIPSLPVPSDQRSGNGIE
jgi:hypothetical protein